MNDGADCGESRSRGLAIERRALYIPAQASVAMISSGHHCHSGFSVAPANLAQQQSRRQYTSTSPVFIDTHHNALIPLPLPIEPPCRSPCTLRRAARTSFSQPSRFITAVRNVKELFPGYSATGIIPGTTSNVDRRQCQNPQMATQECKACMAPLSFTEPAAPRAR